MRIFVVGLMMLGLAGCSFAPDYQRPQMELPQAWKDPGKGEQLDEQWWKRFDDSTLNALVQEALIANRDIVAAVARVDYARAQLGVARCGTAPAFERAGAGDADLGGQHQDHERLAVAVLGGLRGDMGT